MAVSPRQTLGIFLPCSPEEVDHNREGDEKLYHQALLSPSMGLMQIVEHRDSNLFFLEGISSLHVC